MTEIRQQAPASSMLQASPNAEPAPTRRALVLVTKYFCAKAPARQRKYDAFLAAAETAWDVDVVTPSEPGVDEKLTPPRRHVQIRSYRYPGYRLRRWFLRFKYARPASPRKEDVVSDVRESSSTNSAQKRRRRGAGEALRSKLHLLWTLCFPDAYALSIPVAWVLASRRIRRRRNDALITASYPFSNLATGLLLKFRFPSVRWIVELRDPFCNNPMLLPPPHWKWLAAKLERAVFRRADQIWIYQGWFPEGLRYFERQYPDLAHKVCELPYCGFDDACFAQHRREPLAPGPEFRIVHAGNFYGGQHSPRKFLQALARLRQEDRLPDGICVDFYGGGSEYWDVVEQLGLADIVRHHPFVPYEEAARKLCLADLLLWVNGAFSDDRQATPYIDNLPSKVLDYLGTGNPLLALTPPGPARDLVLERGYGYVADPSDAMQIAEALVECLADWRAGRLRRCRDHAQYSVQNQVRIALELLDSNHLSPKRCAA